MSSNDGEILTLQVQLPDASEAYILGEFNNWSTTANPLASVGGGLWKAVLPAASAPEDLCLFVWRHGRRFGQMLHLTCEAGICRVADYAALPERAAARN